MEQWRPVKGYEEFYEVSNLGRVRSHIKGKILSPQDNGKGYFKVWFKGGVRKYIHRLVAEAFCERRSGAFEVNHKDGNQRNNRADNLEWVTSSENTKHAVYSGSLKAWGNKATPIEAIDIHSGATKVFATISQAERAIGSRHITDVLKGKRGQCKGYTFRLVSGGDANENLDYHTRA